MLVGTKGRGWSANYFMGSIFVLATFVHIRNISADTDQIFDPILKVGSWDLFEHIPTATMTFVQATFVLATFVHIRYISAVTNPIFTKL